ncbi:MAG TPA: alkaline phosphatase family protein [Fimbriimonadaceae bacterium]|nr:alkaline phosphatase family protein [Fimbriimonadaceae bacterium]
MRRTRVILLTTVMGAAAAFGAAVTYRAIAPGILSNGKLITPLGESTDVGSYPTNMVLSPNGRYAVVSDSGYRQQLSVIDVNTGELKSKVEFTDSNTGLYYGLAFGPGGTLYASRGAEDKVSSYGLSTDGKLTPTAEYHDPAPSGSKIPHNVAGVALLGGKLLAVNNQTHPGSDMAGSLSVIDMATDKIEKKIKLPGFPYGIAVAQGKAFVASERDGVVSVVDIDKGTVNNLRTGENATCVIASKDGMAVYVSNSNSDTISVIDPTTEKVVKTLLVRPPALRGLPGCTPQGMALSPDQKTLYVALSDLNAVCVIDLASGDVEGYLPTGWYPTAVVVSPDAKMMLVANAKGVKAANANDKPVGDLGQYILNIIEGTVTRFDLQAAMRDLKQNTKVVLTNNRAEEGRVAQLEKSFKAPPIEHVIYIIKENRTYDQVLGDIGRGNSDPSICLFPEDVTPNQHALARRFVQLDNFHVCAEVSADGWNWSTSGMANEYVSRNSVYNYAGRGRNYVFEGTNNGVAVDMDDLHDVATAPNGYIWDQAKKQGVSMRNYGFFLTFDAGSGDKRETIYEPDNAPAKKALYDVTDPYFKRYDTSYADSEAWVKLGIVPAPKQLQTFGKMNDKSRMTAWIRDYQRLVKEGNMPQFMMVRLGRNHTAGTSAGQSSPRAMVADNDYAVGQVVDTVSHGPYWDTTAIFIVEDDAQAGFDHVDAHRSIAFVVSPYTKRGSLDSRFYNTDSVLRTMGLILGLRPWNQYVATALPMRVFANARVNAQPYDAILPSADIIGEVNTSKSYRAADSARMMNRYEEESLPDIELNDILWGSIKGAKTPRPQTPGAWWRAPAKK